MSPDFLIAGQAVMYRLTDCQLSVAGTSTEHYEVALHPWLQIPAGFSTRQPLAAGVWPNASSPPTSKLPARLSLVHRPRGQGISRNQGIGTQAIADAFVGQFHNRRL
jgi:hypothetical protein